ncbi:MAG: acyclic terpene utilization AtuA family protein [Actinomycetes bacterium]
MSDEVLRIANVSGFYGDRFDAFAEQLTGGPVDVLTGDWLAELTMLILYRSRAKDPSKGYASTFLHQLTGHLQQVAERGVKVVANAGGLNPAGLAAAIREAVVGAGVDLTVAHVSGDDLLPRIDELRDRHGLAHLDEGTPLAEEPMPPLTANAYLGGWGIAEALGRGADIVVTGRVTDASVVVGPAAWRFGWARDDWDRLAGAVVAGHVIECGAQATGGNYAFFTEVPGLEHPGFPIAEVHADGSSVITKHEGTGGLVSVGTVTAQLLYEVGGPLYLNPDVTTDLSSVELEQVGPDRVRISGVEGAPPTDRVKVCINTLGGFRNQATFLLTGLDVEAKAELLERTLRRRVDLDDLDEVDVRLVRSDHPDATTNAEAVAQLHVTVKDRDPQKVGRRAFAGPLVELALASYPGFTMTAPPADADPFGVYWPALVPKDEVREVVTVGEADPVELELTAGVDPAELDAPELSVEWSDFEVEDATTQRVPLGTVFGARSGDKGGNANVGVWATSRAGFVWLARELDVPRFRELVPDADGLEVTRTLLPNLLAVNFVVHGLLGRGVSSATRPDPQAKGLGEYLRSRLVDLPAWVLEPVPVRLDERG